MGRKSSSESADATSFVETILVAIAAMLVLAPGVLLVVASQRLPKVPTEQQVELQPIWADARRTEFDRSETAEILVRRDRATILRSPGWEGQVSEVLVGPGDEIESLQQLATVGPERIRLLHSEFPFTRDLKVGDVGRDVSQLQRLLATSGFLEGDLDGEFGWRTRDAVEDFNEGLAITGDAAVFHHDAFVWSETASLKVGRVHMTPGAVPPAVGEPVIESVRPIASARLVTTGSTTSFEVHAAIEVGVDGGPTITTDDPNLSAEAIEQMASVITQAFATSASGDAQPEPGAAESDGGDDERDDLARLSAATHLVEPETVYAVPASAVLTASESDGCVITGSLSAPVIVPVSVVDARPSEVYIVETESVPDRVLVNPFEMIPGVRCD